MCAAIYHTLSRSRVSILLHSTENEGFDRKPTVGRSPGVRVQSPGELGHGLMPVGEVGDDAGNGSVGREVDAVEDGRDLCDGPSKAEGREIGKGDAAVLEGRMCLGKRWERGERWQRACWR